MWQFLKRRHTYNSDEISGEESQASDKLSCICASTDTEGPVFTIKATYHWALHALAILIKFLYSTVPHLWQTTNAAMAPAKLKHNLTTHHNHMTSKRADYFKRPLESRNRVKLVSEVTVSEKTDWGTLVPRINVENGIKLEFLLG
jgi:hypothetical protein